MKNPLEGVAFNKLLTRIAFNLARDTYLQNMLIDLVDYLENVNTPSIWEAATSDPPVSLWQYDKYEQKTWVHKLRGAVHIAIRKGVEEVVWQKMTEVTYEDVLGVLARECYDRDARGEDKPLKNFIFIINSKTVRSWFIKQITAVMHEIFSIYRDEVQTLTGKRLVLPNEPH